MIKYLKIITFAFLGLINSTVAVAGGVYQEPADFINEVFDNEQVCTLMKQMKRELFYYQ